MLPNGSYTLSGSIAHGEKLDKDRKKLKGKYTYGHIDSFGNFTQKKVLHLEIMALKSRE